MIRNYFKIAFRNLWKHRAFSFINIMGLTVGMTACFLIFLYVRFELSYDAFHSKADRIYRVVADLKTPTEVIKSGGPSWAIGPRLKRAFPEVESFVRVSGESFLIRKGEVKFQEENTLYADSTLFEIFDFKLLHGDPRTALKEPLSIVFSESTAKKYFGNENPVGQTVLFTVDALPAKVTGVFKDLPENSQIKAELFVSMTTFTQRFRPNADNESGNYGNTTYLLLKPGTNIKALEAKFPPFLEKTEGDEMRKQQMFVSLALEPLRDVYLYSTRYGSKTGNINNVYIFSITAVFILFIACINFINLTTARSVERAREVGIRKVVGALRSQLARQFIWESVFVCLVAFLLTTILCILLIPLFNQLAGKTVSNGFFENGYYVLIIFLAAVAIGLVAGFYPALVLSAFKPVSILKGRFSTGTKGIALRKGLVVAQFTISISLIIATIVVYKQMGFMRNQDLGFNKDQMLIINTNGDPARDAFKQAITNLQGVRSTAMSSSVPGGGNMGAYSEIENNKGDFQVANLDLYFVDFDFIGQYKIRLAAGRPFSRDFQTDTTQAMLINEAALKLFGYRSAEEAIGRRFKQWGNEGRIIGVMKDFHFRSLQKEIKPLTIRIDPRGCQLVSIKVASENLSATMAAVEHKWKALIPNRPFSYFFLDDFFDKQYRAEERFGKLFLNFAILAIFISCLGLLGLASYSTIQRTKEIGIRKTMGASVLNIVNLLSKDFLKLVLLSFFISAPLAWFSMHKWLQDFAYRIDISWWVFIAAGVIAVMIALFTISFQAIKAAIANPVKSLKTE